MLINDRWAAFLGGLSVLSVVVVGGYKFWDAVSCRSCHEFLGQLMEKDEAPYFVERGASTLFALSNKVSISECFHQSILQLDGRKVFIHCKDGARYFPDFQSNDAVN